MRPEIGYCGIEWSQAATTTPDSFDLDATLTTGVAVRLIFLPFTFIVKFKYSVDLITKVAAI